MEITNLTPQSLGDVRQIIATSNGADAFTVQVFITPDCRVFDGEGEGRTLGEAIGNALADME